LKLEAEAAQAHANAEKFQAEAAEAKNRVEVSNILTRAAIRKEHDELAGDLHHQVYNFNAAVTTDSVKSCMNQLKIWHRTAPTSEIEICFFSPGGSVIDGLALYDYIQSLRKAKHNIITSTVGYAASMGGILLQAGDIRRMSSESYVLVHEISAGAVGKFGEMEDEMIFIKKIQGRILNIFASRSKLTAKQWESKWSRKDLWLDSTECLQFGLVDEVV